MANRKNAKKRLTKRGKKLRRLAQAYLREQNAKCKSVEDDKKGCVEAALTEDAWMSCQTDVNKLVKRNGCPEEDNWSLDASDDETCVISLKKESYLIDEVITPEQFEKTDEVDEKPEILLTQVMTYGIDDKTDILSFKSPDEWVIKKSLCRCCHAEGTFTSLQETKQGEDIAYDNMLESCFNIQLFPVSSAMGAVCTVCALCAARLRDAFAFSQQVRACEAHFRDLYQKNIIKVPNVKIEVKEEPQDANDDFNFEMDAASDAPDHPVVDQEINSKKVKAKRKNHKNTSTKIPKETAPKEKKPRALQSTLINKLTEKPPPVYTRVGDTYKCTRCERVAGSYKTIRHHFNLTHLKEGAHKCTLCLNRFMDETRLLIHKLKEHNIDERFKCNACDKVYYHKKHLKHHVDTFHMMGKTHKCSMCDLETYDRHKLLKHLVKHKTSKDFHCKYCKKSFLRKNTLNFHERIHTGDKRKACAECGQKFVQKASLNYHMTKYHPEVRF